MSITLAGAGWWGHVLPQPPPITLPLIQCQAEPGCVPLWCTGSMLLVWVTWLSLDADVQALNRGRVMRQNSHSSCGPTTGSQRMQPLRCIVPACHDWLAHEPWRLPAADGGGPLHLGPSSTCTHLAGAVHPPLTTCQALLRHTCHLGAAEGEHPSAASDVSWLGAACGGIPNAAMWSGVSLGCLGSPCMATTLGASV